MISSKKKKKKKDKKIEDKTFSYETPEEALSARPKR